MSQDPQSESKAWWQTLPGLLTAGAAVLTALTGLLVALNQIGLFHHHPRSAASESSTIAGPVAGDHPASVQLRLPANAEMRTEDAVYTLLSARVSPYAPGQVTADFTVRMTNNNRFDANFWFKSFSLWVNGAPQAPANDLDDIVPANGAKEATIEFVIPANTAVVSLQMGDVGGGKPAIVIHLQNR